MASSEPWCKLRGVLYLSLMTLLLMPWKERERARNSDEMSFLLAVHLTWVIFISSVEWKDPSSER